MLEPPELAKNGGHEQKVLGAVSWPYYRETVD
jgi:hypothetical protein